MPARGRPRTHESAARRQRFVRLILTGANYAHAAREARIQPLRALAILDELEAARLLDQRRQVAA